MSVTLADLRTRLAYRLNENSSPSDTNEVARRDSFINEGYRKTVGERYWWFLATIGSQSSVDGQEIYTLDSNFRDMIELRLNRKICLPIPQEDAFSTYNFPPLYYQYRSIVQKYFVYDQTELHLLPLPSTTPSTLTVSSITQTSGTATITTSTAHELQANDYVTIAGADQSGYNGEFRVLTAPTSTTFTITVDAGTVSPATGTITCVWNNLVYRFWQTVSDLSASSDAIVIPDRFSDILVAYAYGRYGTIDDSRANAADGFKEYNSRLKDMMREQNRMENWWKQVPPQSHEYYHE